MIILNSEKTCEQVLKILNKQTKPIERYPWFLPIGSWDFWNNYLDGKNALIGKIKRNKFSVILPDSSMGVAPYRFFYGEVRENTEGKAIIKGKFKQPPATYVTYLIIGTIIFGSGIRSDLFTFLWSLFMLLMMVGIGHLIGVVRGKRFETATIEYIEKIIAGE